MPSPEDLTNENVNKWKEDLFDGKSLKIAVAELYKWPLEFYLWAAVFQARDLHFFARQHNEQNWQTPAWDFGRFAKAHPKLVNLNEDDALCVVKEAIGSKFWEAYFGMCQADAEMAFDDIWVKCRAIPGYDPLTVAMIEAKQAANQADPSGPAGYNTFLQIAKSLRRQLHNQPFYLPCHKLASLMSCTPMTVSRYRQKAIRTGLLKVVKEHKFRPSIKGEATEFLFVD